MTDHRTEALQLLNDRFDDEIHGEPSEAMFAALVHAVLDLATAVRERNQP